MDHKLAILVSMSGVRWVILLAVPLLFLAACGAVEYEEPPEYRGPADQLPPASIAPASPVSEGGGRGRRGVGPTDNVLLAAARAEGFTDNLVNQGAQQRQDQDRQMIYSAQMTVEVARVDDAIARCLDAVGRMGGYLSNRRNSTLTCRIPAASLEELLGELRAFGRVLGESMQASDVTRQYVDLGIRLDNARRSRERLLELLEQAEQVEDMLKIETELRRLTTEIEQMEGQLRYLTDQVAMSTVSVTFQAVSSQPPNGPRKESRFQWINLMGAEYVLRWF